MSEKDYYDFVRLDNGVLSLHLSVDIFTLKKEDREFVCSIIDRCLEYKKAREAARSSIANGDSAQNNHEQGPVCPKNS